VRVLMMAMMSAFCNMVLHIHQAGTQLKRGKSDKTYALICAGIAARPVCQPRRDASTREKASSRLEAHLQVHRVRHARHSCLCWSVSREWSDSDERGGIGQKANGDVR
jgi:hypothetical protein